MRRTLIYAAILARQPFLARVRSRRRCDLQGSEGEVHQMRTGQG